MTVWRLYRFRHPNGRSKDWAVTTLADGSTATRWGKTANRLPGVCQRQGDSQNALERKKLAKGYVFVATVTIDPDGWIQTSGHVAPDMPSPPVNALYWHIACKANHDTCVELAITTRQLVSLIQSLPEHTAIPAAVWMGWQQLIELSLKAAMQFTIVLRRRHFCTIESNLRATSQPTTSHAPGEEMVYFATCATPAQYMCARNHINTSLALTSELY